MWILFWSTFGKQLGNFFLQHPVTLTVVSNVIGADVGKGPPTPNAASFTKASNFNFFAPASVVLSI